MSRRSNGHGQYGGASTCTAANLKEASPRLDLPIFDHINAVLSLGDLTLKALRVVRADEAGMVVNGAMVIAGRKCRETNYDFYIFSLSFKLLHLLQDLSRSNCTLL